MAKKSNAAPSIASDRDWRARSDAQTLAEAKNIQCDPKRMSAAAKAAKTMVADKQTELQGLKHVARKAK